MRTLNYALKGKDVPAHLVGTVITIRQGETIAESAAQLTVKGESDVNEKFNDGYAIALQGLLRTRAGGKKVDGKVVIPTAAELQAIADGYRYTEREEGEGVAKATKPETKQKNAASDSGEKLHLRCLENPKFLKQMLEVGVVEQEKYDAWLAARDEAARAKATPAEAPAQA